MSLVSSQYPIRRALLGVVLGTALTGCRATSRDIATNAPTEARSQRERLQTELASRPDGDVATIHRLWTTYLQSRKASYGCTPSPHWVSSEQGDVTMANGQQIPRCYDHATGGIWPGDTAVDVLAIEPVGSNGNLRYRVTTRFRNVPRPSSSDRPRTTVVTVYAVREGDAWKLSSATHENSRSWRREKVGPITYVVAPGWPFSRRRAEAAVAFADSLSKLFDVPPLQAITYYVVKNGDEMMRLYGVQTDTTYGTPGGQSLPGMIVSGDSVFGERHGHEIAHTVLFPLYFGKHMHVLASEGIPIWLGGTQGKQYPEVLRALQKVLVDHPATTLDSLVASPAHPMYRQSASLLAAMIHERRGAEGISRFLNTGSSLAEFKAGVSRILDMPWEDIAVEWRRRALQPG